jgi:RecB family exonuclease
MSTRRIVRLYSYEQLEPEVSRFLAAGHGECLVLASARGLAADLLRRNVARAIAGVHTFTLTQFAAVAAASPLAIDGKKPANALAAQALTARVVHTIRTDAGFKYFGPVAASPGFSRALMSTISELRMNRVSPEHLAAAGLPGRDLALCLTAYYEQLRDSDLADIADVYQYASAQCRAESYRLAGLPLLLWDVPLRTVRARELVAALAGRSPEVLAFTLAAEGDEAPTLEQMLGVSSTTAETSARTTVSRVRSHVFSPIAPAAASKDDTVSYFSAPGEALECVEIARRIHELAESQVPFDRLAILLRHPGRYQPLVEEALRRASVPAYFSRGVVRPDPAGRAFLALLACALEECSASRFAEYLSLGQVPGEQIAAPASPLPSDEMLRAFTAAEVDAAPAETSVSETDETDEDRAIAGTLQAPAGWEDLLIDASVIGGAERWERRLRGLENELKVKTREAAGSDDGRFIHMQLERLRNLESFALPLIRRLHELPQSAFWREYIDLLSGLARVSLRRPESVLGVLAELAPMADVGPVRLEEVSHVLGDRLRTLRRDPHERRYGRVFVGSIEEARGRFFKAVFLPGLAEGLFPATVAEDPLLLDTYRGTVSPDLQTNKQRREQERLLLRIALAAGERIVFSYPRIDLGQSRPRVPSFYALEIIRAANGHLPPLQEFQSAAAAAAPTRLDRPAPENFSSAIDDTEYDLVALENVKAGGVEQDGALNYLTSVNAALARSLRTRYQRWNIPKWTAADGLFEPTLRRNYGLTERAYSPTTLQHFATCPYRFALHGIFGLRQRETAAPLYQMDALTRGALFHEVQRDLFRTLLREGMLPVHAEHLHSVREITDRVLDDVADRYADKLAPAIPRVWRSEIEEIRTDLHGWLPYIVNAEWTPSHFELAFGLRGESDRDPHSVEEPTLILGGIKVRGSIDLVERHRSRNAFRIIDHKTGKAPDRRQLSVGGGSALQPLLYALAAREILGGEPESGALFFCTQRGNYEYLPVQVTESNVKWLRRVTEIIDGAILGGKLSAAPAKGTCDLCDFRPICGPYEEQRLRRKNAEDLQELDELRSMP